MCFSQEYLWFWWALVAASYFHDLPNDPCHFILLLKRKQEERVQQVRKKLEEALMADILSRAADTEEMDIEMDSGDEA